MAAELGALLGDQFVEPGDTRLEQRDLRTAGRTLDELAEKALASAFTSLEAARLEAQRQQLYLETIAQPNLADYPLYPKRLVSFGMVLVSCLLAYGIAWLLVISAREHAAA